MPFHSPYDPEACTDEFGWLWCDTDGKGRRWNMVTTFFEPDALTGPMVAFLEKTVQSDDIFTDDAEPYRGMPYIAMTAPHLSPDRMGD